MFSVGFTSVAAAILAAVEGGILPPGLEVRNGSALRKPHAHSAAQDARLYGRQDACRCSKQIPRSRLGSGEKSWLRMYRKFFVTLPGSNRLADAFRGWRLAALPPAAFWQLFSLRVTDNFVATFTLNSAVQAE